MKGKTSRAAAEATKSKHNQLDSWEKERADIAGAVGVLEAGIERVFRFIEMVAVIALLLVAVGDRTPPLGWAITVLGSGFIGFYATLPITLAILDRGYRLRWGRRRAFTYYLTAFASVPAAAVAGVTATRLARIIEAALQSS